MERSTLVEALVEVVGPSHVLTDDLALGHTLDWTGRWRGECLAVTRPASAREVSAVVRLCSEAGVPIVPQGGNTGLVGGAVPQADSVVVSTVRLNSLGPVDAVAGQVTAGAGVTLSNLAASAAAAGWRYGVDFAARDSATVGGTIATNAGGHHVLRHGMTRRQVVGIEAVMADGSVVSHLGGLVKDNTGYDLAGLFCGSEGTLAIVTTARLALVPVDGTTAVAMVGFADLGVAMTATGALRRALPMVEAIELMCVDGLEAVADHLGLSPPVLGSEGGAVLLIETASNADATADLAEAIGQLEGVTDTAMATDPGGAARLWRWREAHTEVINSAGPHPPHKMDVTVALTSVAAFVAEVRRQIADHDPGARVWIFGHAGDGNIHVNITGPEPDDPRVDEIVLRTVASFGGSISAEHGIGRAKREWLHLSRSPAEIAAFRAIKHALDPAGRFNPGVLLPIEPQRLS